MRPRQWTGTSYQAQAVQADNCGTAGFQCFLTLCVFVKGVLASCSAMSPRHKLRTAYRQQFQGVIGRPVALIAAGITSKSVCVQSRSTMTGIFARMHTQVSYVYSK